MPPRIPINMQYRTNRFETFTRSVKVSGSTQVKDWTNDKPDILNLVDNGFFFTPSLKNLDQVTCVCCGKKEHNINEVDNISRYHLLNNPDCALSVIVSSFANFLADDNQDEFWSSQTRKSIREPLTKESIDMRRKTYKNYWKFDNLVSRPKVTSKSLSESGFYYSPIEAGNDRVFCMYCDCCLDHWDEQDDPIQEHISNLNGNCYFLKKYHDKENDNAGINSNKSKKKTEKKSQILLKKDTSIDEKVTEKINSSPDTFSSKEGSPSSTSRKTNKKADRYQKTKNNKSLGRIEPDDENVQGIDSDQGMAENNTSQEPLIEPTKTNEIMNKSTSDSLPDDDQLSQNSRNLRRTRNTFKLNETNSPNESTKEEPEVQFEQHEIDTRNLDLDLISLDSYSIPQEEFSNEEHINITQSDDDSYKVDFTEELDFEPTTHIKITGISEELSKESKDSSVSISRRTRSRYTLLEVNPDTSNSKSSLSSKLKASTESDTQTKKGVKESEMPNNSEIPNLKEPPNDAENNSSKFPQAKKKKGTSRAKTIEKEPKKTKGKKKRAESISNEGNGNNEALEKPSKKKKKLKLSKFAQSPSPQFFDTSNQNIGDYDEGHVDFHEMDDRPKVVLMPLTNTNLKRDNAIIPSKPRAEYNVRRTKEKVNSKEKIRKGESQSNQNILDASFSNGFFGNTSDARDDVFNNEVEQVKPQPKRKRRLSSEDVRNKASRVSNKDTKKKESLAYHKNVSEKSASPLNHPKRDENDLNKKDITKAQEKEFGSNDILFNDGDLNIEEEEDKPLNRNIKDFNQNRHSSGNDHMELGDRHIIESDYIRKEVTDWEESQSEEKEEDSIYHEAVNGDSSPIPDHLPSNISGSTDIENIEKYKPPATLEGDHKEASTDTKETFKENFLEPLTLVEDLDIEIEEQGLTHSIKADEEVSENNQPVYNRREDNRKKQEDDYNTSRSPVSSRSSISPSRSISPSVYKEYVNDMNEFKTEFSNPQVSTSKETDQLNQPEMVTVVKKNQLQPSKNDDHDENMHRDEIVEESDAEEITRESFDNKKPNDLITKENTLKSESTKESLPEGNTKEKDTTEKNTPKDVTSRDDSQAISKAIAREDDTKENTAKEDTSEAEYIKSKEQGIHKSREMTQDKKDEDKVDIEPSDKLQNGFNRHIDRSNDGYLKPNETGERQKIHALASDSTVKSRSLSFDHQTLFGVESSTPEKRKESLQPPKNIKPKRFTLELFEDELLTMSDTVKYLESLPTSKYGLYNDIEGEITDFIAAMPEEEENMTIEEWLRHNATSCANTVRDVGNKMINSYASMCDEMIKEVESLPEE